MDLRKVLKFKKGTPREEEDKSDTEMSAEAQPAAVGIDVVSLRIRTFIDVFPRHNMTLHSTPTSVCRPCLSKWSLRPS